MTLAADPHDRNYTFDAITSGTCCMKLMQEINVHVLVRLCALKERNDLGWAYGNRHRLGFIVV